MGRALAPPDKERMSAKKPDNWREEWVGMPEFVQNKQKPYAQVIVRFETEADLEAFSKLIGQKLTQKTKSIWHPAKSHFGGPASGKAWIEDARKEGEDEA
jgi:hypothetical protein